jgi:hypothetical protein
MDSTWSLGGVGMCLGLSEEKGPSAPQVFTFDKVRKTPSWHRSLANFSRL